MFGFQTLGKALALASLIGLTAGTEPAVAQYSDWAQPAGVGATVDDAVQPAAYRGGRRCPCPPGWVESTPTEAIPGAPATSQNFIPENALASAVGVASGPESAVPNMIGDFLGGNARFFGESTLFEVQHASVGVAGGDRRFKIADDQNPIPVDRLIFDYNGFQNPLLDVAGNTRNLQRFTFGIEKTFRDGLWSFEFRVPFTTDYNSTQSTVAGASLSGTEFGNMVLVLKRLVVRRENFAASVGVGADFPSGADFRIDDATGTAVEIWNESIHLQPFVGAYWTPTDRLFFLGFAQLDFDTRGSTVLMRDGGGDLARAGRFTDQTLAMLDLSVGYWLHRNPNARWLTALAPMAEIHYTSTLQDSDTVTGTMGTIGASATGDAGRRDVLNLTGGVYMQLGTCSDLRLAYVAPLGDGVDREFDGEFVVQFNRRF